MKIGVTMLKFYFILVIAIILIPSTFGQFGTHVTKVSGGERVTPFEVPYQVLLKFRGKSWCTGSILNSMVILTAAHCVYTKDDPTDWEVVAGENDQRKIDGTEQTRNVSKIFIHKDYYAVFSGDDIAIFQMSSPLRFTISVQNIDYPTNITEFFGNAKVSGWGLADGTETKSMFLNQVVLPLQSDAICRKNNRAYLKDSMLCAGGERKKDACRGDSGGPLTCTRKDNPRKQILCGIVSFGPTCADSHAGVEYPGFDFFPAGVYTEVSHFIDWIDPISNQIMSKGRCGRNEFYCVTESHKVCHKNVTHCKTEMNPCIPTQALCNGKKECLSGEDELICESNAISPQTTTTRPTNKPTTNNPKKFNPFKPTNKPTKPVKIPIKPTKKPFISFKNPYKPTKKSHNL